MVISTIKYCILSQGQENVPYIIWLIPHNNIPVLGVIISTLYMKRLSSELMLHAQGHHQ